jgi:YfiH family protein
VTAPPVLTSPLLAALPGVRHAFFTRQGGVSAGPYESLNLGPGSGDDPTAVTENRRRAAAVFGLGADAIRTCYQIHSARVVMAEGDWSGERPKADGVFARQAGLICGALAADCAPVLLADAEARMVAAVHAGWRGALGGVVASTVDAMTAQGAKASRVVAVVGPCIAQASYEVGLEFLEAFVDRDPGFSRFFAPGAAADKRQFDLPGFVLSRLEAAGVGTCEWIGHDTCAEANLFFSNRRAFRSGESDYGRLMSAIMLES